MGEMSKWRIIRSGALVISKNYGNGSGVYIHDTLRYIRAL